MLKKINQLINAIYFSAQNDFFLDNGSDIFSTKSLSSNDPVLELTSKLIAPLNLKGSTIKRQKMIYHCKFGEFGTGEAQFTEPSGVAVTGNNEIVVADTNNHRIQVRLRFNSHVVLCTLTNIYS